MSWLKRDSPFRSSLRGKLAASISAMTLAATTAQSNSSAALVESSIVHDAEACFDSFKNHWHQAWETMCRCQGPSTTPRSVMVDQISGVLNHLDQLMSLLLNDLRRPNDDITRPISIGPLLDLVLTEDILGRLLAWSLRTGEFVEALKLEQLKLYEALIAQSVDGRIELLVHKPILQPLLRLLSACGEHGAASVEHERRLVVLLNQLCVLLARNPTLLEFFFNASPPDLPISGPTNFLIFSLLIPFVHREGAIGQQARDALLLCMSLSRENEGIGVYIAQHSNFCPVLATGLSGLYSLLPRKLAVESESDWHCFTPEDIQQIPELGMFLNSLEFCNAVIQVAHQLVQEQLLEYINHGFLFPVLVPALQPSIQQNCIGELTAATAYLELFIRTVTEPSLLQAFLKMLLLNSPEAPPVVNDLIRRIACQQPLSLVTLALFHTLLNLNCEDVMLELVFKYLIPCTHLMVSQRCRVREIDMFGKTAEKFLSLTPASCLHSPTDTEGSEDSSLESIDRDGPHSIPSTLPHTMERRRRRPRMHSSSSLGPASSDPSISGIDFSELETSFLEYLIDAQHSILSCMAACRCWTWPYDGEQPAPDALLTNSSISANWINRVPGIKVAKETGDEEYDFQSCATGAENIDKDPSKGDNLLKIEEFSTDVRLKSSIAKHVTRTSVNERRDTSKNGIQYIAAPPTHYPTSADGLGSPDLGPFLSMLLTKLENMMSNSLYENLQLTGVLSRLACYPQPLLRSFLLNHSLVFQPSVRSLLQVLGTLKQKLDSFFYTEENVDNLISSAKRFLATREERPVLNNGTNPYQRLTTTKVERRGSSFTSSDSIGRNRLHNEGKRRSITEMLFGKSTMHNEKSERNKSFTLFEALPNDTGYRYIKSSNSSDGKLESLRTKNTVLSMVVLGEFLKELSAIAMEHAVVCDDEENVEDLLE